MQEDKRNKRKRQNYRRDKIPKGQDFEGTFPKGQKKREKKRLARQHKLNEGEERKVL